VLRINSVAQVSGILSFKLLLLFHEFQEHSTIKCIQNSLSFAGNLFLQEISISCSTQQHTENPGKMGTKREPE
jgi:hypothetical protein